MSPLVYATARAREQARELAPDALIENEVRDAILRGDVCAGRGGFVFLDSHQAVAKVVRYPGRLRDRPRQWLVTRVVRHRDALNNEEANDGIGNDGHKAAAAQAPACS